MHPQIRAMLIYNSYQPSLRIGLLTARFVGETWYMTPLKRILTDFRLRRNLDGYVTIAVAVVVGVLSYVDVVPSTKVSSLILAVLAVLAFSLVTSRSELADAVALRTEPRQQFLADFPPELIQARNQSDDLYLIGVDLGRTIETSFGAFEKTLRRGGKIRILLTSPKADDAAIDARSQFSRPEIADLRNDIVQSLRKLDRLKTITNGDLQVRTTKTAMKFGLNYIDVQKATAALYIQLYSYRLPGESRPLFRLTAADGEWFECYRDQVQALWGDAEEHAFP